MKFNTSKKLPYLLSFVSLQEDNVKDTMNLLFLIYIKPTDNGTHYRS